MDFMKILFVINQLDCGGSEQQLIALCTGLKTRGHEPEVICMYNRLQLRNMLDAMRIPVRVVPKYSKLDFTIIWRLSRLFREAKPDIINAYLPAACLFTGMTRWLGVSIPILLAERSIDRWKSRWRVSLDNIVRGGVAGIICNADAVKAYLVESDHVPSKKLSVIYNGLSYERRTRPQERNIELARRQIGAPSGTFVVSAVANFSPVKRHDILLRAFRRAKERANHLFLVLVGSGPLQGQIRALVDELGLGESSTIISSCTNPLPLLCASNAAILTSEIEGCSNALLEAMAMGLPVVATDVGGNRELVTHGLGGIICQPGDVCSLSSALCRLADDSELSTNMGQYNMERVRREFSDDIMVERTLALYQSVLTDVSGLSTIEASVRSEGF